MYIQVKPFLIKKGGTTQYLCLQNVRLGYGIPARYGTATAAWKGTEQHRDRNIPKGVDVPLYFSYRATIDNITADYGHIGVQLASGAFWSDGKLFKNLKEYEASHAPKYLGWGESVNEVRVIQEEDMYKGKTAEQWAKKYEEVRKTALGYKAQRDALRKVKDPTSNDAEVKATFLAKIINAIKGVK